MGYLYRLHDSERIDVFWAAVAETGFQEQEDSAALLVDAVFAPNSTHRVQVTPAKWGRGKKSKETHSSTQIAATQAQAAGYLLV